MALLIRTNDALKVNPPMADHNLTDHGSDWLWAVTAIYCLLLLVVIGMAYMAKQGEKM